MQHQTDKGFTLVEMLVSISILAVITAFTTANFDQARKGDELRVSSQLIASSFRRAQTAATGGELVWFCRGGSRKLLTCPTGTNAECTGGGLCSREVPAGYGVHFTTAAANNRKVVLFADTNDNKAYDAGEDMRSDSVSPGVQVSVTTLVPNVAGVLDVVFQPPKPAVFINGGTAVATASVSVTHRTTGLTKTVTINRISGQVNADQ